MNEYNADSIRILSDLDHIRLNPAMYIGDIDNPHHILQESIDNALDECLNNFSDGFSINISKNKDGDMTYQVTDYGRGIPYGIKEVNGKEISILEALTTKSNSGGKFDSKSYLNSTGLHGLGLKCVNALSDNLIITSINNGYKGHLECVKGEPTKPVIYKLTKEKSGTSISFTICKDNKYFDTNEVPLDFIVNKLNTYQAFGIKNIKLIYDNKEIALTATSPFDLHKHPMDNGENAIIGDVVVTNSKQEKLRLSFNYIAGSSTSYKFNGYTNYLYNKDGGGHIMAAQDALVKAFNMFCEKRNITIPSTMASDYFIGLNAIVSCNIIEKAFASQTKDKLITGTGTTRNYFNELVELLAVAINEQVFDKHVGIVKAIVQRIADYRKERENRKELKGLSQYFSVNQSEGNTVRRGVNYDKLTEAGSKNRNETELLILEGDSASSGCIKHRDKMKTAILSLKGKLKNIVGCTMTEALKNKEISGIISVVGTGIFDKCNINRIRYGNIYYVGDSDSDGYQIQNLVISFFVNYMPEVVKAGKLKLVISPLYIYKDNKGEWQGADSIDEIPKNIVDKQAFTRIKGIGEYNPDQLKVFVLDSNRRKTVTVEYPSDLEAFNDLMGTSQGKRNLLMSTGLLKE